MIELTQSARRKYCSTSCCRFYSGQSFPHQTATGKGPADVQAMAPKDLSAQPVLAHGKQSGDWRTGYIEHAEGLINYHNALGGRELGAARAKQLPMVYRSQHSARR